MNTIDTFMNNVSPEPMSGCWLWTGYSKAGKRGGGLYGRIGKLSAHRVAYELFKGPLTPGLYVCHKCDVTLCVNPEHLFQATNRENQLDCNRKGRRWSAQGDHCRAGHRLEGYNLIVERRTDPLRAPRRRCRECINARKRRGIYQKKPVKY